MKERKKEICGEKKKIKKWQRWSRCGGKNKGCENQQIWRSEHYNCNSSKIRARWNLNLLIPLQFMHRCNLAPFSHSCFSRHIGPRSHLRSMKRMSIMRRVWRGSGLGAGASTVITWAWVSTAVTTIKPQTGLSKIPLLRFSPASASSSTQLTLSTWWVRSRPGLTGTSFSCVSSCDMPSGRHESGMEGAPIL